MAFVCRSKSEGGRRCRCSGGTVYGFTPSEDGGEARREAARRQYRTRQLGRTPMQNPPDPAVTGAKVAETKALMLTKLQTGETADEEIIAYTDAVIAHGDGLRNEVMTSTVAAWEQAGVGDAVLDKTYEAMSYAEDELDKTDSPLSKFRLDMAKVNTNKIIETRAALFQRSVFSTIMKGRNLGHTPRNISPLSSRHTPEVEAVMAAFPSGILKAAELRYTDDRHSGELHLEKISENGVSFFLADDTDDVGKVRYKIVFDNGLRLTHELSHYLELGNAEIVEACRSFFEKRTQGKSQSESNDVNRSFMYVDGNFAHDYVGSIDEQGSPTEVFAVGVEALFTAPTAQHYGGLIDYAATASNGSSDTMRPDPEHLSLILGLLATANKDLD